MTHIPDPFYNKVIQFIVDFCFIGVVVVSILSNWIISSNAATNICSVLFLIFFLVCIYDKFEQHRYLKLKRNDK